MTIGASGSERFLLLAKLLLLACEGKVGEPWAAAFGFEGGTLGGVFATFLRKTMADTSKLAGDLNERLLCGIGDKRE